MIDPSQGVSAPAQFRRLRLFLLGVAMVLACVAVAGFFVVPSLVRVHGERLLTEALGRSVEIDEVRANPFRLSVELRGLRVRSPDGAGDALTVDSLFANFEAISAFQGGAVLSEVRAVGPYLHVARLDDGRYDWSDVIERLTADSGETGAQFSLNNIRVVGGRILFDDVPRGLHHEVTEVELGIPFVSNLPIKVDVFVEPSLSARVNGDAIAVRGRSKPFSDERDTLLDIELEGVELSPYLSYLPFRPAFRLASGRLTTHMTLAFAQPADGRPTVTLKGTVQVGELEIQDKAGVPVIRMPEAAVELTDVQPLARKWHFARLRLQEPQVDVVRLRDGGLNIVGLLPRDKRGSSGQARVSQPVDFLLESARVRDGRVSFVDRSLAVPFKAAWEAVAIDLRNLASTAGEPADLLTDFVSDAGEKFRFQDRLRLVPFELEGRANVDNLQPARYDAYLAAALPGAELRGGRVDGAVRYRWSSGPKGSDAEVVVETLGLRDLVFATKARERPLLALAAGDMREVVLRPYARSLRIAEVGLRGADVALRRDADGGLGLPGAADGGSGVAGAGGGTWTVAVSRLSLEEGSLRLQDRTASAPVDVDADQVRLVVEQLDTQGGTAAVDLVARINQRTPAKLVGTLAMAPFKAELKVDVDQLDLVPLQAYVADRYDVTVSSGRASTQGRVIVERGRDGTYKGRYRGDVGVANFSSIDRVDGTDLLRWRAMKIGAADLQFSPLAFTAGEVSLGGFHSRLVLDEQGRLTLRGSRAAAASRAGGNTAGGEGTASAELAPVDTALPPLRIGKIVFKEGNVAFSDRFIRPNYDARLGALEGVLSGLSTDPSSMAQLEIKGRVDDAAAVVVSGRLSPFRDDRFLDLAATIRDFDLPPVSAYAGKYVGYGIERGKLSAELRYKVERRRLTATNRVFVDQLVFGDRVEGGAAALPVHLGVALLKNRRGEIDLNLPVSGSLDDPQFSVAGLVFKAFANIIVKAAAAPFAWLGSALGGGEELSYVEFVPGVAVIDEAMRQKLAALARLLDERPGLRLDIAGRADPRTDTAGLRQALLERELRVLKRKAMLGKSGDVPAAEALVVSAQDYPELLLQLYRESSFDKPRTFFGGLKELPVAEMEAMMLAHTVVSDTDLRQLAQLRAQVVRDWLLREGKVAPERIYLVAPRVASAGDSGGRRTEFALR